MAIARERLKAVFGLDEPVLTLAEQAIEPRGDVVVERLVFRSSTGEPIRGILVRPPGEGPHPAILYAHSHGGRYEIGADELLDGREYLLSGLGEVFARAGYVTLCLDMRCFGQRNGETESAASKALLWHGKSLFGQMLSENAAALTWLATRPDVEPARLGMFGISMGSTLSYWLAAVEPRLKAIAHLCCYADYDTLIELGAHDSHGIYLTVPGLLAETSTGEIAGLVAPRPQLICIGEADGLTPPLAVDRALAVTRPMYADGPLEVFRQPGIPHAETPEMRARVLDFFARQL